MPIQVDGVLVRAMPGTELSRVRTEFRLHLPEPTNKSGYAKTSGLPGDPPRSDAKCGDQFLQADLSGLEFAKEEKEAPSLE